MLRKLLLLRFYFNIHMKLRFTIFLLLTMIMANAQSVGVRAGLNYSTFRGPTEPSEKFGIANGFHFGINYGYMFTDKFMLRTELQYGQTGTTQKYNGDSYYLIYLLDGRTVFERGKMDLNLDISNGYVNIPISAAYQLIPRLELFGGFNLAFMINPIGRGTLRFESDSRPNQIVFRQTLDYRFFEDEARAATQFNQGRPIGIIVDGERQSIPKSVGAYYQSIFKDGGAFRWYDVQASAGANFFINRGFFIGGKLNYGLLDITRNQMDRSIEKLNTDNTYILRNDFDRNLGLEVSVGFRF
jgi:hypothetical protein